MLVLIKKQILHVRKRPMFYISYQSVIQNQTKIELEIRLSFQML